MEKNPKLIVFDLDYTLWPFWIDTHVTPPFQKKGEKIVDLHGQAVKYYPDVPNVLKYLSNEGYKLGVASRTSEIQGAKQLLNILGWDKYFQYKEIYPGCKVTHFSKIQGASNIDYKNMIFFDDEHRNIVDVNKLGVLSVLVKNGVTHQVIKQGLELFSKQR